MPNTDKAWEQWGRENPYFGVLAHEKFSADQIARNQDEFFATGRAFIPDLLERYETLFGALKRDRAMDHGCGVGRLTLPLAQEFAEVVALDVAPSMLLEAQANARTRGTENAQFALADDDLTHAPGAFDFVNSHIVLQHIPVRRGLRILSRLIDKVRPGGGFHVHVSFRTENLGWRLLYWSSANIPGVKVWQNICAGRRWNAPAMQMNDYPLNHIVALLTSCGVKEFFVTTEPHARFITCSLLGKKSGGSS
ncbi:MAG: methyltransferase domain-containing protein [Sphingomicrobium sp.]